MARLSWDEMVNEYPDSWVAIKDAKMDGADVVLGEVIIACNDDEMYRFRITNHGKGFVFRRTSEGSFNGGHITSNLRIRVD